MHFLDENKKCVSALNLCLVCFRHFVFMGFFLFVVIFFFFFGFGFGFGFFLFKLYNLCCHTGTGFFLSAWQFSFQEVNATTVILSSVLSFSFVIMAVNHPLLLLIFLLAFKTGKKKKTCLLYNWLIMNGYCDSDVICWHVSYEV